MNHENSFEEVTVCKACIYKWHETRDLALASQICNAIYETLQDMENEND